MAKSPSSQRADYSRALAAASFVWATEKGA
jgi:hypothetical protein